MNHKIPNDLENWVSEKELAAFKKRIPDIEELETYLRKWKIDVYKRQASIICTVSSIIISWQSELFLKRKE